MSKPIYYGFRETGGFTEGCLIENRQEAQFDKKRLILNTIPFNK
jgi:hypothetical protein